MHDSIVRVSAVERCLGPGHALMENRNGFIVGVMTTRATGSGELDAAIELLEALPGSNRITVGANKGYGTADFVARLREINNTPQIAQSIALAAVRSIEERQGIRLRDQQTPSKLIEENFWVAKTVGGLRKGYVRGLEPLPRLCHGQLRRIT